MHELSDLIRQARRSSRTRALAFATAAVCGDLQQLARTAKLLSGSEDWRLAMLACTRQRPSAHVRRVFRQFWIKRGDSIRCEVGNDLALIAALRKLLPPYKGPGKRLFRSDSAKNRKRRTYGMSWSAQMSVAESFALGTMRHCEGGTVLLVTDAEPDEILCRIPARHSDEAEYVVDRRRLRAVRVVARFPQADWLA